MIRSSSNRLIKYGFKTHRAGRTTKRVGIGVAGAGVLGLSAHGGSTFMATGGRSSGALGDVGENVQRLYRVSNIEHRIPAVGAAREFLEPYARSAAASAKAFARRRANARMVSGAPNRWQQFSNVLERAHVPSVGGKLIKYGTAAALGGLAIEKVGSSMVKHGFAAHPGQTRRKVRRFFGMRGNG